MQRLEGKVAIVTGAASGMGAAEARLFADEGARVVLADIQDAAGEALAKELGGAAVYAHLDVSQEAQWQALVTDVQRRFGRLDVLVNNAGTVAAAPLEDTTLEQWNRVIAVNQTGVFLGMKHAIRPMAASGGGSIVNISSTDGFVGMSAVVAYVASKFAVRGMTKTAALELAARGIRVNSIHPGYIDTPMANPPSEPRPTVLERAVKKRVPLGRMAQPREVANLALFLASDESSYCTGAEFLVDGGMLAGDGVALLRPDLVRV
jgi:3alpha(or 20beta)-hydroxysteroid dehydrogenase